MTRFFTRRTALLTALGAIFSSAIAWAAVYPGGAVFSKPVIDVGVVVSDLAAAKKFYTEAIGLQSVTSFDAPAELVTNIGLSDNKTMHIEVLSLGTPGAAGLKLVEVKGATPGKIDNSYIHSALGVRYLTLIVSDIDEAVARAEKAGVKPLAKGVQAIPPAIAADMYLCVFRDPDGNFVELVGPRAKK